MAFRYSHTIHAPTDLTPKFYHLFLESICNIAKGRLNLTDDSLSFSQTDRQTDRQRQAGR